MKKIPLSDNHKRALFASVFLVEKLVTELEHELSLSNEKVMEKIIIEEEEEEISQHIIFVIREIKSYISFMADKYDLQPSFYDLSQIINSRKSKMWEILCDTKSAKMKSRGEFPKEYAQEFDEDIDQLLKLTESI